MRSSRLLIKSWRRPESESAGVFVGGLANSTITLLTVRRVTAPVVAFPAYTLAVGMVNGTGPRSESLAYPMLWCFRQFIELSCKRVIRIGLALGMFDNASSALSALRDHDLYCLWELAKPVLAIVSFGDIESDFFRRVNDVVAELQRLDPRSTAFRYSTTQGGTPSLGSKMLVLRVTRLVDNMDVAMNWLSETIEMLKRRTR